VVVVVKLPKVVSKNFTYDTFLHYSFGSEITYGVWMGTYGGNSELIAMVRVQFAFCHQMAALSLFHGFQGQDKA
jgi:hypothetical protein